MMIQQASKLLFLGFLTLNTWAYGHKVPKRFKLPYRRPTSLTHTQTHTATQQLRRSFEPGPRAQLSTPLPAQYKNFYQPAHFLKTNEQINRYFWAKNNLGLFKWQTTTQQRSFFIAQNIPAYQQAKVPIFHPPQEDMAWLAEQIPAQTNYLFVGERHYFPQIQLQLALFIHELRARYPQRPIVLFSEFVPQGKTWQEVREEPRIKSYIPVFFASQFEDIPVVGLEPTWVHQSQDTQLLTQTPEAPSGEAVVHSVWTSAEGIRLRNSQWHKILTQYRQQYPDALFIIHGGSGHVDYMAPYSLSQRFQEEGVFTVMLTAEAGKPFDAHNSTRSAFDLYTNGLFPDRVLQFKDDALTRMAGFDIQIRVAVEKHHE